MVCIDVDGSMTICVCVGSSGFVLLNATDDLGGCLGGFTCFGGLNLGRPLTSFLFFLTSSTCSPPNIVVADP